MRTGLQVRVVRGLLALMLGASAATACGDDAPEVDVTFESSATSEPAPTSESPTTESPTTEPPATEPAPSTVATTGPPETTGTTSPTTLAPVETTRVNVYWAWTIPTSVGTPERLGAGSRIVPEDDHLVAAVAALLEGPNEAEVAVGMGTAVPAGTTVHGVDVAGGVATVDLDDTFTESSGSLAETARLAQVVFTLTAFDGVDRVVFSIDGEPRDPILSHGFVVGDGFDRDDFHGVRPFIMVEAPTPGEVVGGEDLTVTGESNTFEANVRWELLDAAGAVVDEGFTTASGGMGTWGGFSFTVDLAPLHESGGADEDGGTIVVFETSPRDGTRQNVVEVPFVVG